MKKLALPLLFLAMSLPMFAQTTTYEQPIPQTTCASNVEHCTFYPSGVERFQTGDPWTQLVFDPYHADYCTNFFTLQTTAVWQVLDTTLTPPMLTAPGISNEGPVKLFVLDCVSTAIDTNPVAHPNLYAEIYAFSYVKTYFVRGIAQHHTYWQTMDGSFVRQEE